MKTIQNNNNQLNNLFGDRLVALETEHKSFSNEVRGELQNLASNVKAMSDMIQAQAKPNWQVWMGFLSLLFVLVGVGSEFVNIQIAAKVDPLEILMSKEQAEIDIKFNADAQLRDVQWSEQQRLDSQMWNATALGKISPYPGDPFFQPNISKPGDHE